MTGEATASAGTSARDSAAPLMRWRLEHGPQHNLLFRVGAQLCAIPLEHVVEVMRALPIKPIATGLQYVRGLSIIRGIPLPVVDTGMIVGGQTTHCRRLITVRTGRRMVALAVEAVLGISIIDAVTLGGLPPLLADDETHAIAAIGARDSELLLVLQATRVVPDDLFDHLPADGSQV